MSHCFVTRRLPGTALQRLAAHHDVDVWPESLPPDTATLNRRTAAVDGLLSTINDKIDAALIDGAPRLRAIANYAVGYDNVDVGAAARRGIPVGNTPDVLTDATADLAFALLLAAARGLPSAAAAVREGAWSSWDPSGFLGYSVHGATLGIIGAGRIGQAMADRARGFAMEVLFAESHGPAPGRAPIDELLRRADFVSLHCPLTDATRHLIDAAALRAMKPTAILVNTARGPIVDQAALRAALADGEIAGAGLDVTDPEPLPPDDSLLDAPNLIIVPHIGSATHQARERMAELSVDNLLAALDGRPMPHPVSPR